MDVIPPFVITKEVQFDAGHRVPRHKSKCRNVHGHRYRVVAHLEGPIHQERGESDEGMVMDFGDLKDLLVQRVHDVYDHKFIVYEDDAPLLEAFGVEKLEVPDQRGSIWAWTTVFGVVIVPVVPTAENLAMLFYNDLATEFELPRRLVAVEVWETPTSMARYPA